MKQRVATDEQPFKTGSTDGSGTSDGQPAAAVVVPPDGGWGWVVMVACFLCNFCVDGIVLSSSAILPEIQNEFNASDFRVALVNSLLCGFLLLNGPIASGLANKYGFRVVTILGSVIASVGFAISYYATSPEYLYLSYGFVGGFGICLVYMPAVITVGFWFEKWRALATGIALCGSGVGCFVMSRAYNWIVKNFGWRICVVCQAACMLLCILFALTFKPLEPVIVEEDQTAIDEKERNRIAAEKLQSKFDTGIRMPHDMRLHTKASPHTWMGVSSNTRYPTAEEVFRGSTTAINAQKRRSSATGGAIKSNLTKPQYATVTEKDEQEDSGNTAEATEPLIEPPLRITSRVNFNNEHRRSSTADLATKPLYRDDAFYGGSLARLPQYMSRTSLGYHMAVTHVPPPEEKEKTCHICPLAVSRILATMLDFSLLKSVTFLILAVSGMFTMMGFFVPFMYVPKRALENGIAEQTVDWLVSVIGIANIVGRVACGLVSAMPKVSALLVANIALTIGGLATIFSSFSYNTYFQFAYCSVFGLSVACFAALRPIIGVEFLGLDKLTNCFGLFLLFQGIGAFVGAPIAGQLYDITHSYDIPFYVSGVFLLTSAIMCYPMKWISKWEKKRELKKEQAKNGSPPSKLNKV